MILVASPSRPFSYTAKGTARRQPVIISYESEIKALYAAVDQTSQSHVEPPTSWSDNDSLDFVRTIVSSVMKQSVGDTDDLFQHGCDRQVSNSSEVAPLLTRLIASRQLGYGTRSCKL